MGYPLRRELPVGSLPGPLVDLGAPLSPILPSAVEAHQKICSTTGQESRTSTHPAPRFRPCMYHRPSHPRQNVTVGEPWDAVDRILLKETALVLSQLAEAQLAQAQIVVLDDQTGSLALGVASLAPGADIRVHCDDLVDEARVAAGPMPSTAALRLFSDLDDRLLAGATLVVLRLPKGLAALDEIAEVVCRCAAPDVRLLAGARVKHMSRGMNKVLRTHFEAVTASLGQQRSRVLTAGEPHGTEGSQYPKSEHHDDLDLTVCAHGGAFAGTSVDHGSRFLMSYMAQVNSSAKTGADLGCGTGVLATLAARHLPSATVLAVDVSQAACLSAAATARANDVADRVVVRRADLLTGVGDQTLDVVLCNPPFHRGTSKGSDTAFAMFADAGRALRPGGALWTVYNSHLPYLPALRQLVGPTTVMGQNPRFTVTRSER